MTGTGLSQVRLQNTTQELLGTTSTIVRCNKRKYAKFKKEHFIHSGSDMQELYSLDPKLTFSIK